jgi:hypothetical protein
VCKAGKALLRGVCVKGGERAGVSGVEKLQEVKCLATAARARSGTKVSGERSPFQVPAFPRIVGTHDAIPVQ